MRPAHWFGVFAAALVLAGVSAWILTRPAPIFAAGDPRLDTNGDAERGRLVFAAGDCSSCHATPGQTDPLALGGGLALGSPYGIFRVPNISAHPVDGIGAWHTADLANALITGVSPSGQHYYPTFPYSSYTGMRMADVEDLMAYLRTLAPVAGKAPPHDLSAVFRIRRGLGAWKLLFFRVGSTAPVPTGDAIYDRGAYLVETIGHCAECHSARNVLGAIKSESRFAGAQDPSGTGFVPNITPTRIGHWSEAEIAEALRSGNTPDHGRLGSTMFDVVLNTAILPQSDREAIARYVKSLPSRPTPPP